MLAAGLGSLLAFWLTLATRGGFAAALDAAALAVGLGVVVRRGQHGPHEAEVHKDVAEGHKPFAGRK